MSGFSIGDVGGYDALIDEHASKSGVPKPLLRALLEQESSFDPKVRNRESGATGLAQLMPDTARALKADPTDPADSVRAAAEYLRQGYDAHGDVAGALRYYYGGPDTKQWGIRTKMYPAQVLKRVKPDELHLLKFGERAQEQGFSPEEVGAPLAQAPVEVGFSPEEVGAPVDEFPGHGGAPGQTADEFYTGAPGQEIAQPPAPLPPGATGPIPGLDRFDPASKQDDALVLGKVTDKIMGPLRPGPTVEAAAIAQAQRREREIKQAKTNVDNPIGDTATLRGQLESGLYGQILTNLAGQAGRISAQQLPIWGKIDRGEQIRDIDDVFGYAYMTPEERQKLKREAAVAISKSAQYAATAAQMAAEKPRNPYVKIMGDQLDAGEYGKAFSTLLTDPTGIVQQLSVESFPSMIPMITGGLVGARIGKLPGFIIGVATGSYPTEYLMSFGEALQEFGVDPADEKQVEAAMNHPMFLKRVGELGHMRGMTMAATDAATARLMMPLRRGLSAGKNTGRAAANVGMEFVNEPVGEGLARVAAGQEVKPSELAFEALGAGPAAVGMTAARSLAEVKEASRGAADIVSEYLNSARFEPLPTESGDTRAADEARARALAAWEGLSKQVRSARDAVDEAARAAGEDIPIRPETPAAPPAPAPAQPQAVDQPVQVVDTAETRIDAIALASELTDSTGVRHKYREAADGTFEIYVPVSAAPPEEEKFPDMRTLVDQVRAENGEPPITDEEWERVASSDDPRPQNVIDEEAAKAKGHEATDGQKDAENYPMGHPKVHGIATSIENEEGSTRSGKDKRGKEWSVTMKAHYGHFTGIKGADGGDIDVYVTRGYDDSTDEGKKAFVVNQYGKSGRFDEHKIFLGPESLEAAQALYDAHFDDGSGPARRKSTVELTIPELKQWLASGDLKVPLELAAEEVTNEPEKPAEPEGGAAGKPGGGGTTAGPREPGGGAAQPPDVPRDKPEGNGGVEKVGPGAPAGPGVEPGGGTTAGPREPPKVEPEKPKPPEPPKEPPKPKKDPLAVTEVDYATLEGMEVTQVLELEDGTRAKLVRPAVEAMKEMDDRIAAMRKLLECVT